MFHIRAPAAAVHLAAGFLLSNASAETDQRHCRRRAGSCFSVNPLSRGALIGQISRCVSCLRSDSEYAILFIPGLKVASRGCGPQPFLISFRVHGLSGTFPTFQQNAKYVFTASSNTLWPSSADSTSNVIKSRIPDIFPYRVPVSGSSLISAVYPLYSFIRSPNYYRPFLRRHTSIFKIAQPCKRYALTVTF